MLLNKLESGFLLFQTPQGSMAVEPTFWQRVYLLWTFRNFRQLSLPLLNPRQTALITKLFCQNAASVSDEFEPLLRIGVVEDFVPPAMAIDGALGAKTDAALAMNTKLSEEGAGETSSLRIVPIAASIFMNVDGPVAVAEEKASTDGVVIDRVESAPRIAPDRSNTPSVSRLRVAWSNLAAYKLVVRLPSVSKPVIFRFAGAIGALALCVYFMVAWHQIGAVSGSQTHDWPPPVDSRSSAPAPATTPVAMNVPTAPEAPAEAAVDPEAKEKPSPAKVATPEAPTEAFVEPEDAEEPLPAKVAPPIPAAHRTTTPEGGPRRATAHVARSSAGTRTAALSRVPTSTRRMTVPAGSRGATARTAQSYFDLAKRQMAKGNYSAAAANYKRAWRMEASIAAAKTRQARARRSMQAKTETVANRSAN